MRRAVWCTVLGVIGSVFAMSPSAAAMAPPAGPRTLRRLWSGACPGRVEGCGSARSPMSSTARSLDRTKWLPQTNFPTGGSLPSLRSCHVDNPANVAVAAGNLRLTVRKANVHVVCRGRRANYTSGQVSTYRLFSQKYGRFEARMKVQASGPIGGLQESFWMWPDDRYSSGMWPAAGEIDVAELYSRYNWLVIPYLHYTWNDNGGARFGVNTAHCQGSRGTYNTYTLTWTPSQADDRRQRDHLPGQHLRRQGVPEALHRGVHPGAGRRSQQAPLEHPDPRDDARGLCPGVALRPAQRTHVPGSTGTPDRPGLVDLAN